MNEILICICTFNRNKSLINCLKSIQKLKKINAYKVKILILDNSNNNNSYIAIKKFKKKTNLELIQAHESRRGIVFARNRCLKISKKLKPEFIAFIDDDCKVDKNWLKNIFKLLVNVDADVVTGPQKYEQPNYKKNNFASLFEKKYNEKILKVSWAASNNVFFKYEILKKIKDIKFDKNLNKFGIGEDQLFFSLINKNGYKIYWSKNIFVTEKIHKHRTDIDWIKERSIRLGVLGHYLDIKLYGRIYGLLLNYLKSIYFLFLSIFIYFGFFNINRNLNFINCFYRFYGKIIGPFKIKKIQFLK